MKDLMTFKDFEKLLEFMQNFKSCLRTTNIHYPEILSWEKKIRKHFNRLDKWRDGSLPEIVYAYKKDAANFSLGEICLIKDVLTVYQESLKNPKSPALVNGVFAPKLIDKVDRIINESYSNLTYGEISQQMYSVCGNEPQIKITKAYAESITPADVASLKQAANRQTRETLRAELSKVEQASQLTHSPGFNPGQQSQQKPTQHITPNDQFEELRRAWCDDIDSSFNKMAESLHMPEQKSRQQFDGDSISTDIYIAKQTKSVLDEIERQNDKWGITDHSHDKWLMLISKQLGQAYQALIDNNIDGAPQHLIDHQLRQISALCIQALMNSQRDGKDK